MKKIRYFIPAFIMLFIIFGFSAQNGQESGHLSTKIYYFINSLIALPWGKDMTTFLIRKAAHMTEFGLLAMSFYYGFVHVRKTHVFPISLLFTFLAASCDEWHQTFISGRCGQLRDVMIDTSGGLLFLLLLCLILTWIKRKNTYA